MKRLPIAIVSWITIAAVQPNLCCRCDAAPEWVSQLGAEGHDGAYGVVPDQNGNVFIAGHTSGSLVNPLAGLRDIFLAKYDSAGGNLWTRQFGSSRYDSISGISTDNLGHLYVVGYTTGDFAGTNAGGTYDAFIAKYDSLGNQVWARQIGTSQTDIGRAVSVDSTGNAYLAVSVGTIGSAIPAGLADNLNDAQLIKFDADGNQLWTRNISTSANDIAFGVSADATGNVFVAGASQGALGASSAGEHDSFLTKYDSAGNSLWTRQFGTTAFDAGTAVAADGFGNAYITGVNQTGPNVMDSYLRKYDAIGNLLWTRSFDATPNEISYAITVDSTQNPYISGDARQPDRAFVANYDALGNFIWLDLLSLDEGGSRGVAVDSFKNVYVSGHFHSGTGNPAFDVFIAKYPASQVPEPVFSVLFVPAALTLRRWRRLA